MVTELSYLESILIAPAVSRMQMCEENCLFFNEYLQMGTNYWKKNTLTRDLKIYGAGVL